MPHCSIQSWLHSPTLIFKFNGLKQKQLHWILFMLENWPFSRKCQESLRITVRQTLFKRRCSYFSTSSKCCSEEIANKILKAIITQQPKEAAKTVYVILGLNVHFIEGIKQVLKWLSFLSTISGALEYCHINTECESFTTPWPTLLGRSEEQYHSKMKEKGFSEEEEEKYPDRSRCLSGRAGVVCVNSCLLGLMQLFPICIHGKIWVWALRLDWQCRAQIGFPLAKPKRNGKHLCPEDSTLTSTLPNFTLGASCSKQNH